MDRFGILALIVALALYCTPPGVIRAEEDPNDGRTTEEKFPKEIKNERLHNAFQITEKVITGGQPEDAKAFEELKKLGVKTVISVDGASPDVKAAEAQGLTYIHLPIGYDRVPRTRGLELAKAVKEQPGKIYIHCHHGKHRSQAAAAVAVCVLGDLDNAQAENILKVAHTGKNYTGLWASVRQATRVDAAELERLDVKFVPKAEIPPLAEAMVNVDLTFENLKHLQEAGWRVPADHPDLDPAHEALQMHEHFRELQRAEHTKSQPDDFRKMMKDSEDASETLEKALRAWIEKHGKGEEPPAEVETQFRKISQSCTDCHKVYRDPPKDK